MAGARKVAIEVGETHKVSGLLFARAKARACYVLAHGAGAGMTHPFMEAVAQELAERDVASLRYQFPYMEARGKRPDPPKLAQATVRAAVAKAGELMRGVPLVAGGKSFGGRMTSQAQAAEALTGVKGLVFLGFPLHAAGQPSDERAAHLFDVRVPMLFVQGTRDALADLTLLKPLTKKLGARATLHTVDDGDHSFHVPARSGRKDPEVRRVFLDAVVGWIDRVIG
jgi:hypothetical protein